VKEGEIMDIVPFIEAVTGKELLSYQKHLVNHVTKNTDVNSFSTDPVVKNKILAIGYGRRSAVVFFDEFLK